MIFFVVKALKIRWAALGSSDQNLLRNTALLASVVLVGWLSLARPLAILHQADAMQLSLDEQWQEMQNLKAEAQVLQMRPKLRREAAQHALKVSVTQHLGASAQLAVLNDRATVTLRNTPADALAAWLAQARTDARAIPGEAHLVRNPSSLNGPATWDGTVVLGLPMQ